MTKWRRQRQKLWAANVEWLREQRARRRVAFIASQQQRRDGIARLARAGLHPVALPSLDDAFAELMPPCL